MLRVAGFQVPAGSVNPSQAETFMSFMVCTSLGLKGKALTFSSSESLTIMFQQARYNNVLTCVYISSAHCLRRGFFSSLVMCCHSSGLLAVTQHIIFYHRSSDVGSCSSIVWRAMLVIYIERQTGQVLMSKLTQSPNMATSANRAEGQN